MPCGAGIQDRVTQNKLYADDENLKKICSRVDMDRGFEWDVAVTQRLFEIVTSSKSP